MRTGLLMRVLCCAVIVLSAGFGGAAMAEPKVVASIKPLHSLATGVMEGVGTPVLLVDGAASEHGHALRPSDARALSEADLVFLVGEGLETYLTAPLANLAGRARVVELAETDGMRLLPRRTGAAWEPHDHGDDHGHNHGKGGDHGASGDHSHPADYDAHIWLDPGNAGRIVEAMAAALSEENPENAAIYRANAERLVQRLAALDQELAARLEPVRDVPYVVFHDAYQYFEARYHLAAAGSITMAPERRPGARHLRAIREKVRAQGARCIFSEPQFEPALVETVREGTSARVGELDPLGATLPNGADLYFELMRGLAGSLRGCLAESS